MDNILVEKGMCINKTFGRSTKWSLTVGSNVSRPKRRQFEMHPE
jgi:hypothetical protein